MFNYDNASIENGWLNDAKIAACSHFNQRPDVKDISLLVIHNISLPAGEFNNNCVEDFFGGCLDISLHESFKSIEDLKVSSHLFIRRDGEIIQFVDFNQRAWHAGVSNFNGRDKCNDYSIGIELEGTDTTPYTEQQYQSLSMATRQIMKSYPLITRERIVGHCDIAPGRKTDPGEAFDWERYLSSF